MDESHHVLSRGTHRTRQVRDRLAERDLHESILDAAASLSPSREQCEPGLLADDPPSVAFDDQVHRWLDVFLTRTDRVARRVLPRRKLRALDEMRRTTVRWAVDAHRAGESAIGDRWRTRSRFRSIVG